MISFNPYRISCFIKPILLVLLFAFCNLNAQSSDLDTIKKKVYLSILDSYSSSSLDRSGFESYPNVFWQSLVPSIGTEHCLHG